jgi:serine/threonine-protein kinase
MRHPNITYIHDAFVYDNAFYIVVEKCWYSLDRIITRIDENWLPHIARDVLQALSYIHRFGYVHKDVHPGNVFVSLTSDIITADQAPYPTFKLGDLGITRLEHDIRVTGTILAPWMQPPEAIDPQRYGTVGKPTDVYHTALLLLAVLRREVSPFSEQDILSGLPQRLAERTGSVFGPSLANALQPQVLYRTQTPIEFWREVQAALSVKNVTGPHSSVGKEQLLHHTPIPGSIEPLSMPAAAPETSPGDSGNGTHGSGGPNHGTGGST